LILLYREIRKKASFFLCVFSGFFGFGLQFCIDFDTEILFLIQFLNFFRIFSPRSERKKVPPFLRIQVVLFCF